MAESAPRQSTASPPGALVRARAAHIVHRVRDGGQSLTPLLQSERAPLSPSDQALLSELAYGTLRVLPRLEALLARLIERALPKRERKLEALILVGLYQLAELGTPPHAAVSATVEASRLLGKRHKSGLINALLRRFQRESTAHLAAAAEQPGARWLFPDWLLERLRQDWPDDWPAIVAASNARAPMTLRVNRLRTTPDEYRSQLAQADLEAHPVPGCPAALRLAQPCPSRDLPGFATGEVSVQDSGAQLAAELLDARPGQRVLDVCAAPGGKSAALLERAGQMPDGTGTLDLTAVDIDPQRLASVATALARLGLRARLVQGDATCPGSDWGAARYQRILLDAPCSASGVIRRHPDIKWLRRPGDIAALAATQSAMLDAVWPLLAPGGRLLYATCSVISCENQRQIAAFLGRCQDARELPLQAPGGRTLQHGWQSLPGTGDHDGFYYALLERVS